MIGEVGLNQTTRSGSEIDVNVHGKSIRPVDKVVSEPHEQVGSRGNVSDPYLYYAYPYVWCKETGRYPSRHYPGLGTNAKRDIVCES